MDNFYKILLIEPNEAIAQHIKCWLVDKAQITHVADNKTASILLGEKMWDVVITDISSEEINRADTSHILKKPNPSTRVLIITENIKMDFILTAMKYNADGLFFKPLAEQEFTQRVLQLAEEAVLQRGSHRKVILAVGAHPDDVEFGCAGTLAKHKAEGTEINILTLSLGSVGGNPFIRQQEAEKAAELQGATLFLGDFADTKIVDDVCTIQFIESIINQVQPTHIYTHSIYDIHQDHRKVHQATLIASRLVPNLFCYLSPSSTIEFRPNVFIKIDEYINTKLKVLSAYTSQIDIRPYLHTDMIKATARYWGRFANYALVEPMEVIKEQM